MSARLLPFRARTRGLLRLSGSRYRSAGAGGRARNTAVVREASYRGCCWYCSIWAGWTAEGGQLNPQRGQSQSQSQGTRLEAEQGAGAGASRPAAIQEPRTLVSSATGLAGRDCASPLAPRRSLISPSLPSPASAWHGTAAQPSAAQRAPPAAALESGLGKVLPSSPPPFFPSTLHPEMIQCKEEEVIPPSLPRSAAAAPL